MWPMGLLYIYIYFTFFSHLIQIVCMRCVVIRNNYFLWSVSNYQVFWLRYYAMREEAILCWFPMKTNQTTSQNAPVEPNDNMSSRFVEYSTFLKFLIFNPLIPLMNYSSLHHINDLHVIINDLLLSSTSKYIYTSTYQ